MHHVALVGAQVCTWNFIPGHHYHHPGPRTPEDPAAGSGGCSVRCWAKKVNHGKRYRRGHFTWSMDCFWLDFQRIWTKHHYSIFNHLKLIYLSKFNLFIQIVCLISDGILRNRNPYMPIYFLQIIVQVLTYHEAE